MDVSPGSRRKLSIAMSLIGDAKFIILDEPTSNLDLKSRERIWLLIKKIARDPERAILISTQHIEEAEVLGSRICVLVRGTKKCCDTPDNIKRNFGSGFKVKAMSENKKHQLYFRERELHMQHVSQNHI
jgi:ABC-type multidrug transport system ATPase subunit